MAERSGRGGIAVMQWSATVVQRSGGRRGGSGDAVVRHNGAAVRRGPLRYLMTDRHRISTPATPRCQKSTSGHRARWYARRGNLFLAAVGRDGAAKKNACLVQNRPTHPGSQQKCLFAAVGRCQVADCVAEPRMWPRAPAQMAAYK